MDNDIRDLLVQIMEGQTEIKTDLVGVKSELSGIKTDLAGVKSELSEVKTDLAGVKSKLSEVKTDLVGVKSELSEVKNEVRKNTISIEEMNKKIDVIIEVQSAHKEQNDREFINIHNLIHEKTNLIETALTDTSKDLGEVKESIEVLKVMTGKHEVDINILKRRPV